MVVMTVDKEVDPTPKIRGLFMTQKPGVDLHCQINTILM